MRLANFAYLPRRGLELWIFVALVIGNEGVTIEDANQYEDDFSDITVLQSKNQKFTVYRNVLKRECYLEPTINTNLDHQPHSRTLFLSNSKITSSDPQYKDLGQDVTDFCKNYPMFMLEERSSNGKSKSRRKRQINGRAKGYFKGQTQTQFISFDNEGKGDKGGTAEATAEQDKSRATVQGRLGMGQAQSQSGSGDPCEECAGSVRSSGSTGATYPSTFYPSGSVSQGAPLQQGSVVGPGGSTLYPSNVGYPIGKQPGDSVFPGAAGGQGGYPTQSPGYVYPQQSGTSLSGGGGNSNQQPNVAQGTGSVYPQQTGYAPQGGSVPSQNGGNVPSRTGTSQGGQTGYPQQSGGSPSTQTGVSLPAAGGYVSQNTPGAGVSQGGTAINPQGYNPQTGSPSYGGGLSYPQTFNPSTGGSGGRGSYPQGYIPQTGGPGLGIPQTGGTYSHGYNPLAEGTGSGGSQGGISYLPQGYNPPATSSGSGGVQGGGTGLGAPQGGSTSYPQGYNPSAGSSGSGALQGGSTSYPQAYNPSTGSSGSGGLQGGTSYPQGYNPSAAGSGSGGFQGGTGLGAPQGGGASYPQGYYPSTGVGSGGSQGGISYPQGYNPQPSGPTPGVAPGGSISYPYPQGNYIPSGLNGQGTTSLYPQQTGTNIQGGPGSSIPQQGYTPQGSGGISGGGTYPPQGYPSNVGPNYNQPGYYVPQGGAIPYPTQSQGGGSLGIPQQAGVSAQGGTATYPLPVGGNPQYGGVLPQSQISTPQSGNTFYPTYPQQGGGIYPTGAQLPPSGVPTYPSSGTVNSERGTLFPGQGQGQGTTYPQSGTSPNAGGGIYPQSGFPQGSPTGQNTFPGGTGGGPVAGGRSTNTNYPGPTSYPSQSNIGNYPLQTSYIPSTGGSAGYPNSLQGSGQGQGSGTGIDTSSGSQITPTDPASGESQSLSSLHIHPNGTKAAASAQGKTRNGMAQTQVSGTYTGSFSAQAQTSDNEKSVQSEIFGNSSSAQSSSQGKAGKSVSQSQIQYNYNTGATLAESQGSGINYSTNTQIQTGNRGGMADAQSTGSGSSSSQAQIGFLPFDPKRKDQSSLFEGGGTSSSQHGATSGHSQTQLQGSYKSGTSFIGAAQSSSGKGHNVTKLPVNSFLLSSPPDEIPKSDPIDQTKQLSKKENGIVKSTVPLSSLQNDQQKGTSIHVPVTEYQPSQDQDAVIKSKKYDAYIDRDSSDMKFTSFNAGDVVPGTDNFKIPLGFRGRVTSTAGDQTQAVASSPGQAQTQTVVLRPGKGRVTINNRNRPNPSNTQNDFNRIDNNKRDTIDDYVTLTRSETGELNGDKKYAHTYYTKSSTCGYFTFTCSMVDGSNGRSKVCKPGPLTHSDGTPC